MTWPPLDSDKEILKDTLFVKVQTPVSTLTLAAFLTAQSMTAQTPAAKSSQLSGPAIQNAAALRKRWRPAAAHT